MPLTGEAKRLYNAEYRFVNADKIRKNKRKAYHKDYNLDEDIINHCKNHGITHSLESIKKWLVSQFTTNMTLENYGVEWKLKVASGSCPYNPSRLSPIKTEVDQVIRCLAWNKLNPCEKVEVSEYDYDADNKAIAEIVNRQNKQEELLNESKLAAINILKRKGVSDYDVDRILQHDNFGCIVIMSKEAINSYLKGQ